MRLIHLIVLLCVMFSLFSCGKSSQKQVRIKDITFRYGAWVPSIDVSVVTIDTLYKVGDTIYIPSNTRSKPGRTAVIVD